MGAEMEGDWCPACGGAVIERRGDGAIERAAVRLRGAGEGRRSIIGGLCCRGGMRLAE